MSIEIEQYLSDARSLAPDAFAARHGSAFLVRSSSDGALKKPADFTGDQTNPMGMRSTQHVVPRLSYQMSRTPGSQFFVYPLRKRKPGLPGAPITLGRSPKRDVRIEDLSVSNLHAYLLPEEEGRRYQILDKASRNGTRVGAELLKPGVPHPLPESATVEFGRVRTTFMTVGGFLEFVLDVLS